MKKTLRNKKGFTLAELLIVVAIIAVLVAIAIPIFTSQLEKAREATDEANLRSIYAEGAAALLTEDTTATTDIKDGKLTVSTANGVTTAKIELKLSQQKDGLQNGAESVNIGGIDIPDANWKAGKVITFTLSSDGTTPTVSNADALSN